MADGYIIAGYIPPQINHAVLCRLLVGTIPSSDFALKEFLCFLDKHDSKLVQTTLKEKVFDTSLKQRLVDVCCRFNCKGISSPKTSDFTGHSTKSASTSKTKISSLSVKDILHRSSCSNESTWQKFNHKEVTPNSKDFQEKVLKISMS